MFIDKIVQFPFKRLQLSGSHSLYLGCAATRIWLIFAAQSSGLNDHREFYLKHPPKKKPHKNQEPKPKPKTKQQQALPLQTHKKEQRKKQKKIQSFEKHILAN